MKALVFDNALELRKVPRSERKPGESLVRVIMAGICNTDLEILKGYMVFSGIIGHEFMGLVEESDDPDLVGKRVVGEINIGCGNCSWCRLGRRRPFFLFGAVFGTLAIILMPHSTALWMAAILLWIS